MGQFQRAFLTYRNPVIALALALAGLALALAALPVQAQSGCSGDPCVFHTPTATPTGTPTTVPGPGTPTAVPMPNPSPFPRPNYGIPTSIPVMSFPAVPSPVNPTFPAPTIDPWMTPQALPMPNVVSITLLTAPNAISPGNITLAEPPTAIPLATVNSSLSVSFSTPAALGSGSITGTAGYSFVTTLNDDGRAMITDMISYTAYLTQETANLQYSGNFTIATAPDWYAPYLPREMANIGWTFEHVGDTSVHYSLNSWSYLFGLMIAMPIKLLRALYELFKFLGPFGLFILWLLVIMLPAVLGFKILLFIKNTIIRLINFILTVLDWVLKLWGAIPWYLGGPG